jgi:hypothetical protein
MITSWAMFANGSSFELSRCLLIYWCLVMDVLPYIFEIVNCYLPCKDL